MKLNLTQLLTSFMMLCFVFSFAQEKTVSGKVTDQNGAPLPGVSVLVVGTTTGTQSDFDGLYSISVAQGATLRFSYIGQKTQDVLVGSSNTIDVQLAEDAAQLDEVVVRAEKTTVEIKLDKNTKQIEEVNYAATGFMLFKKRVFSQIANEVPNIAYKNDIDGYMGYGDKFYDFFPCKINEVTKKYESEDYGFCNLYRSIGGKIYADTTCNLTHYGWKGYKGNLFVQNKMFFKS